MTQPAMLVTSSSANQTPACASTATQVMPSEGEAGLCMDLTVMVSLPLSLPACCASSNMLSDHLLYDAVSVWKLIGMQLLNEVTAEHRRNTTFKEQERRLLLTFSTLHTTFAMTHC